MKRESTDCEVLPTVYKRNGKDASGVLTKRFNLPHHFPRWNKNRELSMKLFVYFIGTEVLPKESLELGHVRSSGTQRIRFH